MRVRTSHGVEVPLWALQSNQSLVLQEETTTNNVASLDSRCRVSADVEVGAESTSIFHLTVAVCYLAVLPAQLLQVRVYGLFYTCVKQSTSIPVH